jgi:hypothetical protein
VRSHKWERLAGGVQSRLDADVVVGVVVAAVAANDGRGGIGAVAVVAAIAAALVAAVAPAAARAPSAVDSNARGYCVCVSLEASFGSFPPPAAGKKAEGMGTPTTRERRSTAVARSFGRRRGQKPF